MLYFIPAKTNFNTKFGDLSTYYLVANFADPYLGAIFKKMVSYSRLVAAVGAYQHQI